MKKFPGRKLSRAAAVMLLAFLYILLSFNSVVAAVQRSGKNHKTIKIKLKGFRQSKLSVTKHCVKINGKPLHYTAMCGYMPLEDEKGRLQAKIFFISYTKDGVKDRSKRPVTFAFNGGPGSASIWLHFGALGPKRVVLTEEGRLPPPPYKFKDNPYTWLEFTDLIFIDPVDTGYSRAAKEKKIKKFAGVKQDVKSVGKFIRLYITYFKRWPSPKYIAGESYGAIRAAGLAYYLQNRMGMHLNGLVVVSQALDYKTISEHRGDNDLAIMLFLPSYCATAYYHKKLPARLQMDLNATLKEVERWCIEEYHAALAKGNNLTGADRERVAKKIAKYSGLPVEFVKENNLRVPPDRFRKSFLKKERKTLGYYDGRLTAVDPDPAGTFWDSYVSEPSGFLGGAFASAVNQFIREELMYKNDLPYNTFSGKVYRHWKFNSLIGRHGQRDGYPDASGELSNAMNSNKYLKVFVACGYYDLCTPYYSAVYTMSHLRIVPERKKNIIFGFYPGGHMMYTNLKALKKMSADVKRFYEDI